MSDGTPTQEDKYKSEVDPLFAAAWNQMVDRESATASGEGGVEAETPAAGDQASTASDEGTAADAGDADAPSAGTLPSAGDIAGTLAAGEQPAEPADEPDEPSDNEPVGEPSGLEAAALTEVFDNSLSSINSKMEEAVRATATREVYESIDKEFSEALEFHPMELVGQEVPDVRRGAAQGAKIRINDSAQARDWQDAVQQIIKREVDSEVQKKTEDLKPMMSVVQGSVQLFRNNPDIVPGSKNFDKELATRFARAAATYEVKAGAKRIGWHGDAQPLLNELRSNLAKERGATGARQEERAAQQRAKAAEQPRTTEGRFDAPQAGVQSKSGMSGASDEEDYSTFWSATGLRPGSNLSI